MGFFCINVRVKNVMLRTVSFARTLFKRKPLSAFNCLNISHQFIELWDLILLKFSM